MKERDKKGVLLELDNRFQAIETRLENLKNKLDEFREDMDNSKLKE